MPLLSTLQSVVHSLSQQLAEAQAAEAAAAALARKAVSECAAARAQKLLQSAVAPAQPGHAWTSPGAVRTAEAAPSAVEGPGSSPILADLSADDGGSPAAATDPKSKGKSDGLAAEDKGCINCTVLREERTEMARMMHEMEGIVQQVYGSTIASQLDSRAAGRAAPAASSPVAAPLSPCSVGCAPAAVVSAATPANAQPSSNSICPSRAGASSASMELPQADTDSMGEAHMAERGLSGSALLLSPVAADQTPYAIAHTPDARQAGPRDGECGGSDLRHDTPGGRAQWLACRVAAEVAQLCASSATPQHASPGGNAHMSQAVLATPADGSPTEAPPAIGAQLAASGVAITAVDVRTPARMRAMVEELQEAVLTLTADNDRLLGLLTSQVRLFMA